MSLLKPTNSLPIDIKICVFGIMRVLILILITSIQPSAFIKWVVAVKKYLENLTGNTLHVVLDYYSPGGESILK